MYRHRDTDDWRPSESDSRRSSGLDGRTDFGATSGYRSARAPRRRSSGIGWTIFIVAFLLALAGAVMELLPSWLRR